ncbi:MAG TPA: hypothetical protein VLO11_05600 [Luteolibacter sp.]|nr:hypothetical protein [Luteolibacter sp.]
MRFAFICFGLFLSLEGLHAEAKLRFICVSGLPGEEETVLASRNRQGVLKQLAKVDLRPSGITDWMSAAEGEMHLAVRQDGALESVCEFQYPVGSQRVLVALVADKENNTYKAHVIDANKTGFDKGTVMVVNFSGKDALVTLGTNEKKIESGQDAVLKPGMEKDTTYRQMVSYQDDDEKDVLCHDRHVPENPDSREMLFLMDDETLILKVASLPIFGSID